MAENSEYVELADPIEYSVVFQTHHFLDLLESMAVVDDVTWFYVSSTEATARMTDRGSVMALEHTIPATTETNRLPDFTVGLDIQKMKAAVKQIEADNMSFRFTVAESGESVRLEGENTCESEMVPLVPLMEIRPDNGLPDLSYDTEFTASIPEFRGLLWGFGEAYGAVKISAGQPMTEDGVESVSDSDSDSDSASVSEGDSEVRMVIQDGEETVVSREVPASVSGPGAVGNYSGRYLSSVAEALPEAGEVTVALGPEVPIEFRYDESNVSVRMVTAPRHN